jgi:hypothetical protein
MIKFVSTVFTLPQITIIQDKSLNRQMASNLATEKWFV